jgi:molybdopterin synthase catalytic subunit
VCGGFCEFVGGVITFKGAAQGRTLYLSGTINGVEQSHPFWHKDTEEDENRSWVLDDDEK